MSPHNRYPTYSVPHFTMIPNSFVDEHLPDLTGAETKVLMIIMYQTYRKGNDKKAISLSQLEEATGLSRQSVSRATRSLQERGYIIIQRRKDPQRGSLANVYSLNLADGE